MFIVNDGELLIYLIAVFSNLPILKFVIFHFQVMFLLSKTNPDWWSVRKANGQDGFVPANYVKEIEPKIMQVSVRKVEKVQTMQKVRKTKLIKTVVPVKKIIAPKPKGNFVLRDSNCNIINYLFYNDFCLFGFLFVSSNT